MPRTVVWLLLAGGCDLVFPIESDAPIAACGPYEEVQTLGFDNLADVAELSVDASQTRGFVMAMRDGDLRLTPVVEDGVSWRLDTDRLANLDVLHGNEGARAGRGSPNGDLYLAITDLNDNQQRVFRYILKDAASWVPATLNPLSPESDVDETSPGGAIEINDGISADRFTRHVPIIHESRETGAHFVSIASSEPSFPNDWAELTVDGKRITDAINARHEITQASIGRVPVTEQLVMAYAALEDGESKLFLSEKVGKTYARAARLSELDGDGDEVEPFLTADCQTLYFRRGTAIIKAQAVAP